MTERSHYDEQADRFLERFALRMTCNHAAAKLPPWQDDERSRRDLTEDQHWRVTISRKGDSRRRLTFDFFNSISDTQQGIDLRPYSVLACISSDSSYAHYSPEELAADLGGNPDSRRDYAQAKRAIAFAVRLVAFFTPEEIEALQEIQ